ncbi:hypothetical protein GCM10020001_092790 [Nonomuraea salmonea]
MGEKPGQVCERPERMGRKLGRMGRKLGPMGRKLGPLGGGPGVGCLGAGGKRRPGLGWTTRVVSRWR